MQLSAPTTFYLQQMTTGIARDELAELVLRGGKTLNQMIDLLIEETQLVPEAAFIGRELEANRQDVIRYMAGVLGFM